MQENNTTSKRNNRERCHETGVKALNFKECNWYEIPSVEYIEKNI
mgnify:FL=1